MENRQKLTTRRQIFRLCAAAELVVAESGYRITVRDILSAAKMSRRSFYEIFLSLDDLLDRMHYAFEKACLRAVDDYGEGDATLTDYPSCESLFFARGAGSGPHITDFQRQLHFQQRIARGLRSTPDHTAFADDQPLGLWAMDIVAGGAQ
jgi:AcrR family transcriptional regulator